MTKKVPTEALSSAIALRNVKAEVPVPILDTDEVCVLYFLKQGVTSATSEQEAGALPLGKKEIFVMPEKFNLSEHQLTGATHVYASFDMGVMVTHTHTGKTGLLERNAYISTGHSKIAYAAGTHQALARLSQLKETEEDLALLREESQAAYCAHDVQILKSVDDADIKGMFEAGTMIEDFPKAYDGGPIVIPIPKNAKETVEFMMESIAKDGMQDVASAFMEYFINNPEMIRPFDEPCVQTDQLLVGRNIALNRLEHNAKEHGVEVNVFAKRVTNGSFDEMVKEAEIDPAEDLRGMMDMLMTALGDDMPEEDKEGQRKDADIYSKLMKLSYAKLETMHYDMPELDAKLAEREEELINGLTDTGKELYTKSIKPEIERVSKGEDENDEVPDILRRIMSNEDDDRIERADLTSRQLDQRLEERPEVMERIKKILKEQGKTLDDVELRGEIILPKDEQ